MVPKLEAVPREVCIVWVDHSVLGVWLTQKQAVRAIAMQQRHSLIEVHYRIAQYEIKGEKP